MVFARVCWLVLFCGGVWATRAAQPEFRALWADTFHAGMRTAGEVSAMVNQARAANCNAIIVEVRKRGDAYYNSTIEPKATDVSPQSFDPLADLITKAHTGGPRVEVHAWITTYLIWNSLATAPASPNHPYNLHPEWLSRDNTGTQWDGGNYQFDASLPEVQKHVFNVAMDIISRYDVDGFNFDYVRYSGRTWGYHSNAVTRYQRRFNAPGTPLSTDPNWLQFRRDQVSGLVRKVYLNAIAIKPQIKISADTICFAPGITTDAQWFSSSSAWGNVLQDWRGWMEEGILDLNIPMMYFDHRRYAADWTAWGTFVKEHQYSRHAALGQGSYLNTLSNVIAQLRTARVASPGSNATAAGMAIYSYAEPVTNDTSEVVLYNALVNPTAFDPNPVPIFAEAVAPPVMTWKTAPTRGYLKGTIRGPGGNELDGAIVMFTGPMSGGRTNDATGFYGFANLLPGTYTVTASYSNLLPRSAQVTITTGAVATLDFALTSNAPVLLNLRVAPGQREALLSWRTTNAADAQVEFGLTPSLGQWSWRDQEFTTNHVVLLTGLAPNTNYFFRATSRAGSLTNSENGNFATAGEIVMDNPSAALAGTWSLGAASLDKFGNDYIFATANASAATATYTPAITTPGLYDVFVWYPQGGNRSTNAPWTLVFDGGVITGAVNQTTGGGAWRQVATNRPFALGANGYFQWNNQAPDTGKVIMADGVRFVYANQEPPTVGTVPRWWSEFFFGGPVDALLDPDADGFTTEKEYFAGTHPTLAESRLRFAIEGQGSNSMLFGFAPFHPGRVNELQEQVLLSTNGWSDTGLAPQLSPEGDGVFAITNLSGAQKFYRLRVRL